MVGTQIVVDPIIVLVSWTVVGTGTVTGKVWVLIIDSTAVTSLVAVVVIHSVTVVV